MISEILGEGTYGVVYKAFDLKAKKDVAIKWVKTQSEILGCDSN